MIFTKLACPFTCMPSIRLLCFVVWRTPFFELKGLSKAAAEISWLGKFPNWSVCFLYETSSHIGLKTHLFFQYSSTLLISYYGDFRGPFSLSGPFCKKLRGLFHNISDFHWTQDSSILWDWEAKMAFFGWDTAISVTALRELKFIYFQDPLFLH